MSASDDVTVLITLLNDPRVVRTVESLLEQSHPPTEILVADGGSRDDVLDPVRELDDARIRIEHLPGSVAGTRNQALDVVEGEIVAFLDADEVAPEPWLERLTAPLRDGEAGFSGGPTRPLDDPATDAEAYVNEHDTWFYEEVVAEDMAMLPMGNSAWRIEVFHEIGGFDPALRWGGEDYDVNLRALDAGFDGVYVPDAWVWHDQSGLDTLSTVLRKRYRYMVGASMAYLKNDALRGRASRSAANPARFRHPYELLLTVLKPAALVHAAALHLARDDT